jgi:hypothetical protein
MSLDGFLRGFLDERSGSLLPEFEVLIEAEADIIKDANEGQMDADVKRQGMALTYAALPP